MIKSDGSVSVTGRQEEIRGFSQSIFSSTRFLGGGAGGIMGEFAEGLARKGAGAIYLCDHDIVEITNLNRQRFYKKDIGNNKAISLAQNLVEECTCGTDLIGYPYSIQKMIEDRIIPNFDFGIAGFDNEPARYDFAQLLLEKKKPGIFLGVSEDADSGYVLVQEAKGPCYSCAFPPRGESKKMPCPGVPAVKDILKTLGGIGLYAVDSVLMSRKRFWNLWVVSLSGWMPDVKMRVEKRSNCEFCSMKKKER